MTEVRSHVQRYKGRRFNLRAEVWIYRNLNMSDGPWYSVMQGNRVVGHSRFLAVRAPRFLVQEGGRVRALKDGVKNVHAFVVGTLCYHRMFFHEAFRLTHRAGYLPRLGHFWVDYKSGWVDPFGDPETHRFGMKAAEFAVLSKDGLSVAEPEIEPAL